MGKLIKQNVNLLYTSLATLYNKLANAAFWTAQDKTDAAPTALNWNVPLKTLIITNNLEHSVVSYNGSPVSGSVLVDAGETIDLLVSGDTGYAVSSVTASGTTIIDNHNGTFTVRVKVDNDMTVAISGTTVVAVMDITYTLTNCDKTSGPTTVQFGGTATIVLQADSNYKMPSSLPRGAVTGASITSYTVDANDNTKATLVIGNVSDNVTITINAISRLEILFIKHMFYLISVASGSEKFALRTPNVSSGSNDRRRACLTILRADTDNPCAWNTGHLAAYGYDQDAMNTYSAIPIPAGTTKISIKCNAAYYHFPGLADANGNILDAAPQWFQGTTKKEYNLSDYPTATHFAVSFKIGSEGTTNFTEETYESMGIELTFE